jgi:hypothetical protein
MTHEHAPSKMYPPDPSDGIYWCSICGRPIAPGPSEHWELLSPGQAEAIRTAHGLPPQPKTIE